MEPESNNISDLKNNVTNFILNDDDIDQQQIHQNLSHHEEIQTFTNNNEPETNMINNNTLPDLIVEIQQPPAADQQQLSPQIKDQLANDKDDQVIIDGGEQILHHDAHNASVAQVHAHAAEPHLDSNSQKSLTSPLKLPSIVSETLQNEQSSVQINESLNPKNNTVTSEAQHNDVMISQQRQQQQQMMMMITTETTTPQKINPVEQQQQIAQVELFNQQNTTAVAAEEPEEILLQQRPQTIAPAAQDHQNNNEQELILMTNDQNFQQKEDINEDQQTVNSDIAVFCNADEESCLLDQSLMASSVPYSDNKLGQISKAFEQNAGKKQQQPQSLQSPNKISATNASKNITENVTSVNPATGANAKRASAKRARKDKQNNAQQQAQPSSSSVNPELQNQQQQPNQTPSNATATAFDPACLSYGPDMLIKGKNNNFDSSQSPDPQQRKPSTSITNKEFYKEMQKLKDRGSNAMPPKKSASAYIIFGKNKRAEILKKNPSAKVTEVVKEIARCWGEMTKEDKQIYKEAAKKDKERYERELKSLEQFNSKIKKPKKCLSAYMIFVKEKRPKIVEENPNLGALLVMQQVGLQWQAMSEEEREYFKQKADDDKIRYIAEQKVFYDEVEKIGQRKAQEENKEPVGTMMSEKSLNENTIINNEEVLSPEVGGMIEATPLEGITIHGGGDDNQPMNQMMNSNIMAASGDKKQNDDAPVDGQSNHSARSSQKRVQIPAQIRPLQPQDCNNNESDQAAQQVLDQNQTDTIQQEASNTTNMLVKRKHSQDQSGNESNENAQKRQCVQSVSGNELIVDQSSQKNSDKLEKYQYDTQIDQNIQRLAMNLFSQDFYKVLLQRFPQLGPQQLLNAINYKWHSLPKQLREPFEKDASALQQDTENQGEALQLRQSNNITQQALQITDDILQIIFCIQQQPATIPIQQPVPGMGTLPQQGHFLGNFGGNPHTNLFQQQQAAAQQLHQQQQFGNLPMQQTHQQFMNPAAAAAANPFGSASNLFAANTTSVNNNHSSELDIFGNRTNRDTMQKDQFFDNHGNNGVNDLFSDNHFGENFNIFGNSSNGTGGIFQSQMFTPTGFGRTDNNLLSNFPFGEDDNDLAPQSHYGGLTSSNNFNSSTNNLHQQQQQAAALQSTQMPVSYPAPQLLSQLSFGSGSQQQNVSPIQYDIQSQQQQQQAQQQQQQLQQLYAANQQLMNFQNIPQHMMPQINNLSMFNHQQAAMHHPQAAAAAAQQSNANSHLGGNAQISFVNPLFQMVNVNLNQSNSNNNQQNTTTTTTASNNLNSNNASAQQQYQASVPPSSTQQVSSSNNNHNQQANQQQNNNNGTVQQQQPKRKVQVETKGSQIFRSQQVSKEKAQAQQQWQIEQQANQPSEVISFTTKNKDVAPNNKQVPQKDSSDENQQQTSSEEQQYKITPRLKASTPTGGHFSAGALLNQPQMFMLGSSALQNPNGATNPQLNNNNNDIIQPFATTNNATMSNQQDQQLNSLFVNDPNSTSILQTKHNHHHHQGGQISPRSSSKNTGGVNF